MKKKIRIYSLHPWVNNADEFLDHYNLKVLTDRFEFEWDKQNPEYLFVGEHLYWMDKVFKEFKRYWSNGRNKNCIFIEYLEEAEKPDLNLFDYAICYDSSFKVNDRVTQICPVRIFFKGFVIAEARPAKDITQAREILKSKNRFCNFMYSHPYPERDELFKIISSYKSVDALGKRFHNTDFSPTPFNNHERETTTLRYPYKFTIASENGRYRGYTSEKLLTALQAHSIPIYWGNPEIGKDFNGKAFIDTNKFKSYAELLDYVRYVDENNDVWCNMICEPWQTEKQIKNEEKRYREYISFFACIFSSSIENAKRLEFSMHMGKYQNWFWHNGPSRNILGKLIEKKKIYFDK